MGDSMKDYEPLDLSGFYNADRKIVGKIEQGRRDWHGLPFLVGKKNGKGKCLIAFGKGLREKTLVIPLKRHARHVIFAHRLMDSKILEGEPVGHACCDYEFKFEDG